MLSETGYLSSVNSARGRVPTDGPQSRHSRRLRMRGMLTRAMTALLTGLAVACQSFRTPEDALLWLHMQGIPESGYVNALSEPLRTLVGREAVISAVASTITQRGPVYIEGIGVVVNLKGTGSTEVPKGYKTAAVKTLMQGLRVQVHEATRLINSPDSAVVRVIGMLDRPLRKGDLSDVSLWPVDGSASLEGGVLLPTSLHSYAGVEEDLPGGNVRRAKRTAVAEGLVVAKPFVPKAFRTRVFSQAPIVEEGARLLLDWDFFGVAPRDQSGGFALFLEYLLRGRFGGRLRPAVSRLPKSPLIRVTIPDHYLHDWKRFYWVVHYLDARALANYEIESRLKTAATEMHSTDWITRYRATCKLAGLGVRGTDVLEAALTDKRPEVRLDAAEALAPIGRFTVLEPLKAIARTGDRTLKVRAVLALGTLGAPAAGDFLETMIDDDEPLVAHAAINSLVRLGSSAQVLSRKQKHWRLNFIPKAAKPRVFMVCAAPRTIAVAGSVRVAGDVDITVGLIRIRYKKGTKTIRDAAGKAISDNSLLGVIDLFDRANAPFSHLAHAVHRMAESKALNATVHEYME